MVNKTVVCDGCAAIIKPGTEFFRVAVEPVKQTIRVERPRRMKFARRAYRDPMREADLCKACMPKDFWKVMHVRPIDDV